MKKKDVIRGEELESINSGLFNSFDPEDESWIGGSGSKTVTSWITYTPSGCDAAIDYDISFAEIEDAS
jgi:hypothetical protein